MVEYDKDSYEYNFKVCLDRAKSVLTKYDNLSDMELIDSIAKNIFNDEVLVKVKS